MWFIRCTTDFIPVPAWVNVDTVNCLAVIMCVELLVIILSLSFHPVTKSSPKANSDGIGPQSMVTVLPTYALAFIGTSPLQRKRQWFIKLKYKVELLQICSHLLSKVIEYFVDRSLNTPLFIFCTVSSEILEALTV